MKFLQALKSKVSAFQVAFVALFTMASLGAHAALPAWATSMGEDMSTAVTDAETLVGPIIALCIVAMVVIKLIKRFSNKI